MRRLFRKLSFFIFIGLSLLIGVLYWSNKTVINAAKGLHSTNIQEVSENKVGIILGTSKYRIGGGINDYFSYRIDAAVDLFNNQKIEYILVSGDNRSDDYNEPKTFQEELIKRGIPREKIYLDTAGLRTLDSMIRAKKVFGLSKFTVISQRFHNERAIYLAKSNGMDVIGYDAKDVTASYGFKTRVREYFARTLAVIDVFMGVEPSITESMVQVGN